MATRVEMMLKLVGDVRLVRRRGTEDVFVVEDDPRKVIPLRVFVAEVATRLFEEEEVPVSRGAQAELFAHLHAIAVTRGEEHEMPIRVARVGDRHYIDLGDDKYRVVKIEDGRWETKRSPRVLFFRPRGHDVLPVPDADGELSALRKFVNIKNDVDWIFYATWIVHSLRANVPYGVLALLGDSTAGKTTAAEIARRLIDPHTPLMKRRMSVEDLDSATANNHVIAMNNLSAMSSDLSDAMSTLSEDGGSGKRELWTSYGEAALSGRRPLIVTSITDVMEKEDLLNRTLTIPMSEIASVARKTEEQFEAAFLPAYPMLFGGVLNALAYGLAHFPKQNPSWLPRLDLAPLSLAIEPHLGVDKGAIEEAYRTRDRRRVRAVLHAWPMFSILHRTLSDSTHRRHKGSFTDLLDRMRREATEYDKKALPPDPTRLSKAIRFYLPTLRRRGWKIELDLNDRHIEITLPPKKKAQTKGST